MKGRGLKGRVEDLNWFELVSVATYENNVVQGYHALAAYKDGFGQGKDVYARCVVLVSWYGGD